MIEMEPLKAWIGRARHRHDIATDRIVDGLWSILDRAPADEAETAPGLHWCLAPWIAAQAALGADGHPARGDFLPPVPLAARMWAGGRLELHDPLRRGDAVDIESVIEHIRLTEGKTGPLCFVTIEHRVTTMRGLAIRERQDIVYRHPGPPASARPADPAPFQWTRRCVAEPVLLFRYSALTFNGHRIHYDRDYARDREGYPGLVVHGPLQATLLLDFATTLRQRPPSHFEFRALAPLFDGQAFDLRAAETADGLALWVANESGGVTMRAEARW